MGKKMTPNPPLTGRNNVCPICGDPSGCMTFCCSGCAEEADAMWRCKVDACRTRLDMGHEFCDEDCKRAYDVQENGPCDDLGAWAGPFAENH